MRAGRTALDRGACHELETSCAVKEPLAGAVSREQSPSMFEGFNVDWIDLPNVRIRVRHGGSGPSLLLLHGHPRTHTTWHRVAPILARDHTDVCPDLRGYGQSSVPPDAPDHAQASKRAMASDAVGLMSALGHERFAVVGHDRGAYVALRTALDHPARVSHLVVLDAVPIGEALARTNARFAQAWPHWFFFGLPDKPERAILADPDAWYSNDRNGWAPRTTRTTAARSTIRRPSTR